jgi:hypothetical protein
MLVLLLMLVNDITEYLHSCMFYTMNTIWVRVIYSTIRIIGLFITFVVEAGEEAFTLPCYPPFDLYSIVGDVRCVCVNIYSLRDTGCYPSVGRLM